MAKWTNNVLTDRKSFVAVLSLSVMTAIAGRAMYHLVRTARAHHSFVGKAPSNARHKKPGGSSNVPYPSSALPGARDVHTPYGSIRVNEWGPVAGRKVLCLHGISTPSIAFARMATKLAAEDGCRVMTFDLFGRGYSDTPDPSDVKHDIKLFTTQIMLVLASSSVPWTGEGNEFTLIGYSLGGGIAVAFASYFPHLLDTLVLIAPSGLMPTNTIRLSSRLIYGEFMPTNLQEYLVRRRIIGLVPHRKATKAQELANMVPASAIPGSEPASNSPDSSEFASASNANNLLAGNPASAQDVVVWQIDDHPGFLRAFISSIQHAPIGDQHQSWRLLGSQLSKSKETDASTGLQKPGLRAGKVLLLLGKEDSVVLADDTAANAVELLGGKGNVQVEVLQGGHEIPITNSQACVDSIRAFWASAPANA